MRGILCFGDSLTFGRGEIPNIGWCGRLKNYFEPKNNQNVVYNLGVSGHDSNDLLKRFSAEANGIIRLKKASDKYLILIAIGTNDAKWSMMSGNNNQTTSKVFKNNIQQLINQAKKIKASLAFIGILPADEVRTMSWEDARFKNKRLKEFNNIITYLCEQNNILFLDVFDKFLKLDYPSFLEDGLHLNSKGYNFLFEEVKKFIEENKLI